MSFMNESISFRTGTFTAISASPAATTPANIDAIINQSFIASPSTPTLPGGGRRCNMTVQLHKFAGSFFPPASVAESSMGTEPTTKKLLVARSGDPAEAAAIESTVTILGAGLKDHRPWAVD